MNNTAYTLNNTSQIDQDLKIFIGTYEEIYEIQKNNQVVNLKWYLAWDTGEIYIGNNLNKLIRFGGSNTTFSESEIKEIVNNTITINYGDIISTLRKQLSSIQKNINENYYKKTEVDEKLKFVVIYAIGNELLNNLNKYKNSVVLVIENSNDENITYKKGKIYSISSELAVTEIN